jgi:transposase
VEEPYLGRGKKNAKIWRAWIVFLDESGISERPPVRRTWAPRGRTPILRHPFNWKKLSICSAIGYRWDGQASRLYFRVIAGSYNDEKLISFLAELKKQLPGRKLILVWDGLPSHRSRKMTDYLNRKQRWLSVVPLPAYAPDMNPVESLWANILGQELANRCVNDLGDMVEGVRDGFRRVHSAERLLHSFLNHAGLFFG